MYVYKYVKSGIVLCYSYETVAEDHNCRLTLMEPHRETPGTWRCDVDIKSSTAHGFLKVQTLILDPENPIGSYTRKFTTLCFILISFFI